MKFLDIPQPVHGRQLSSSTLQWRDDYVVKNIYIEAELDKLDTGMKDYVKGTVMPYIEVYLKKVFGVHSERQVDLSSYTDTCISANVPTDDRKVHEADLVLLITT